MLVTHPADREQGSSSQGFDLNFTLIHAVLVTGCVLYIRAAKKEQNSSNDPLEKSSLC